eukprot:scaffold9421_cov51-Phaeocystis_antarctica.AAC.2
MSESGASAPMVRKGQIALTSPAPSRADATLASDCAWRTMKTFLSSLMASGAASRQPASPKFESSLTELGTDFLLQRAGP